MRKIFPFRRCADRVVASRTSHVADSQDSRHRSPTLHYWAASQGPSLFALSRQASCLGAIKQSPPSLRVHTMSPGVFCPSGIFPICGSWVLWMRSSLELCVVPGVTTLLPCPQSATPCAAVGSKHALKVEAVEGHLKLILLPGCVPLWLQHFRHLLEPLSADCSFGFPLFSKISCL